VTILGINLWKGSSSKEVNLAGNYKVDLSLDLSLKAKEGIVVCEEGENLPQEHMQEQVEDKVEKVQDINQEIKATKC
jgi:hypothetical protein